MLEKTRQLTRSAEKHARSRLSVIFSYDTYINGYPKAPGDVGF